MTATPPHLPRRQRGMTAVVTASVLSFAMLLTVLFVHRDLLLEHRSAANHHRASLAFEAAEAGKEWALAQLNLPQAVDEECKASSAGLTFRRRLLDTDPATGMIAPLQPPAMQAPGRAACVHGPEGWDCDCPMQGPAAPAPPGGTALAPAFTVHFAAASRPGVVKVRVTGCSNLGGPCSGSHGEADAVSTVHASFGHVSGLAAPPSSALTARGDVSFSSGTLQVRNQTPSTAGIAIDAGGNVDAASIITFGLPGTPSLASVLDHNQRLAALSDDVLFRSFFAMSKAAYRDLPFVVRVTCAQACAGQLQEAYGRGARVFLVDGDLKLPHGGDIGSNDDPVVLVVQGAAEISGPLQLHGALYAGSVAWRGGTGIVYGAVVSESTLGGQGQLLIARDEAVLGRLARASGGFAPIAGTWSDF